MKSAAVCLALVLLSACLWAQGAPAAPPPPSAPPHHHEMGAMHDQHVAEMKAQVEKMRATLDQMKANLAKMKDPATKQQGELDLSLWDAMISHMEGMVKMMSQHPGMGMGMMHGEGHDGGMDCCTGMKEGGCCGGGKCMRGPHHAMDDKPAPPADEKK
ncbi:MAG: hypothetical protein LAO03_09490 [Acidobacteriia bacterium]|nr:hypothetical protein [Terriglobia bacterium]